MTGTTIEEAADGPPSDIGQFASGWQEFETEKLELCLPDSYVGGDPRRDLRGTVEHAKQLGPLYESLSERLESPRSEEEWRRSWAKTWTKGKTRDGAVEHFFKAFDADVESWTDHDRFPNVYVLHEKVGLLQRGKTLQAYLSEGVKDLSSKFGASAVEQSIVPLGPYEAGRLVVELEQKKRLLGSTSPGMWQLSYAIKDRQGFWLLGYTASSDDWQRLLPIFEKSAATLRLKEVDAASP